VVKVVAKAAGVMVAMGVGRAREEVVKGEVERLVVAVKVVAREVAREVARVVVARAVVRVVARAVERMAARVANRAEVAMAEAASVAVGLEAV
jgi:hypothetical protein